MSLVTKTACGLAAGLVLVTAACLPASSSRSTPTPVPTARPLPTSTPVGTTLVNGAFTPAFISGTLSTYTVGPTFRPVANKTVTVTATITPPTAQTVVGVGEPGITNPRELIYSAPLSPNTNSVTFSFVQRYDLLLQTYVVGVANAAQPTSVHLVITQAN